MNRKHKNRPRTAPRRTDTDDDTQDLRALCRALQFWRVCGKAPCRRALDCAGDAETCFHQFWWELPEEARVWVRAAIRESAAGRREKAANRAADAEVVRWRELQMRYAPKAPAAPADQQLASEMTEPKDFPRIRTL